MYLTRTEMVQEAIRLLENLTKRYNLSPAILNYFKDGMLYYSYLADKSKCCIEKISYDPRYEKAVQDFERKFGHLVFHAIVSSVIIDGKPHELLALMYVSKYKEDLEIHKSLYDNTDYFPTYCVNFTNPEYSECGDIIIGSYDPQSSGLVRFN